MREDKVLGKLPNPFVFFDGVRKVWELFGAEQNCKTHYREGGHAHHYPDFCVLFDFMSDIMSGKTSKDCPSPYDDINPIHDYNL